ncbi:hypothetical protein [Nannocystis sp. SCPEA4]|uniref:hypothetical protein n=1 Tax=Nannocystis sp. SCPEA4 TaxID=2996787 RepID=UPI00226DC72E|nr:hypothetical protein [Nannocystis sp. SCPEA4]MCY1057549.1 hypothetical protein [Nannocystis sp. SCPEA4]
MKHGPTIASLFFLLTAAACGDDGAMTTLTSSTPTTAPTTNNPPTTNDPPTSDSDGTASATDTTAAEPPTSTTSVEGGPVFLSLSTNVGMLTQDESVIITAILTDPDGVDDIVGGSLLNGDGSVDFGPFVAAGQEGTYSITLTWAQIHQAEPIHFENAPYDRTFSARFFDQAAHAATKTIPVTLQCTGGSACDGTCTDLNADGVNCGTCGHTCTSMGCEAGACKPAWSECFMDEDGFSTCTEICQSLGETCAESQCQGSTTIYLSDESQCGNISSGVPQADPCDTVQDWGLPAIRCCCTDSD